MKELFKFNHECPDFSGALGVPDDIETRCREMIFFASISSKFIAKEFYEGEEPPRSLCTVTGHLERTLVLTNDIQEQLYILVVFRQMHELAMSSYQKWCQLGECNDMEKKKLDLILQLIDLKGQEIAKKNEGSKYVTDKEMFKRIELISTNISNFPKYLDDLQEKGILKSMKSIKSFDIDSLIQNVLKSDDL